MSSLTLTLIQPDLHWEDPAANLAMLETMIRKAGKTEVVILPEMFSTGFSMNPRQWGQTMEGETVAWMRKVAMEQKIILTGSVIIREGEDYFNRLIWMLPNGQYGYYNKRHLFAFAGEHEEYTPGSRRLIAQVKGWKINLQVCYDLRFPVWARQQHQDNASAEPEYDILIYVANWPERRSFAWKTLLQARAIENQCYVVGVNRVGKDGHGIEHSGDSMVVDPMGATLFTHAGEPYIHTITLQKADLEAVREKLPFLRDRDAFSLD